MAQQNTKQLAKVGQGWARHGVRQNQVAQSHFKIGDVTEELKVLSLVSGGVKKALGGPNGPEALTGFTRHSMGDQKGCKALCGQPWNGSRGIGIRPDSARMSK